MSYTMYTPLNVWLDPASVTDVVAYIQTYLSENTIYSETEIETIIHDYLIAHPELIGGVQSVNGKTGTVVLSASDINTANNVTIESVLSSLSSQISSIAASVATNTNNITSLTGRVSTAETDLANLKSSIGVSPEDYGAKGDGVTDDTAAFNAALDANDFVFIGGGNYYINGTVTMSANKKLIGNAKNQYIEKSRITLGSTGYIHVVGAACIIRNIHFKGEDAVNDPSTYQPKAVVADRVSPYYDIDLTIEDCIFVGFTTSVTVNGRGLYLRKTLFTYYGTAVKTNFVSAESGDPQVDSQFGGRAFCIEDNRFHTAGGGSNITCYSILVNEDSAAYGMIINRNLFDGLYGEINLAGEIKNSLISDNVFIVPKANSDGCGIHQDSTGRINNLTIDSNLFDAESLYKYNGTLPNSFMEFDGETNGIVITSNQFSYTNAEAIAFNGSCSDSIISNNLFNNIYYSDTATGKAISFNCANNVTISGNEYRDNQFFKKTNSRMFVEFLNAPSNTEFSNNVAIKGNTVDISNPTYQTASGYIDGENIRVKQSGNYGLAYIKIDGLDVSTVYTVCLSIIERTNTSNGCLIGLSTDNTITNARVTQNIGIGTYYLDQVSNASGELYLFLRPTNASGVTGEALFGNIRIKKGFMPDTGEIDLVSDNFIETNGNSVDKENTEKLNAIKSMTVGAELFNVKTATIGKGQQQSGLTVNLAAACVTDFIEVTPGFTYSINQSLRSSSNYNCFYDENGLLVSAELSQAVAPLTVVAPANAKYLRALGLTASIDSLSVKVAASPS